MARTLARGHGGDVFLSEAPGGGLRATVVLPHTLSLCPSSLPQSSDATADIDEGNQTAGRVSPQAEPKLSPNGPVMPCNGKGWAVALRGTGKLSGSAERSPEGTRGDGPQGAFEVRYRRCHRGVSASKCHLPRRSHQTNQRATLGTTRSPARPRVDLHGTRVAPQVRSRSTNSARSLSCRNWPTLTDRNPYSSEPALQQPQRR